MIIDCTNYIKMEGLLEMEYWLFSMLWLIAILPKTVQFIIIGGLTIALCIKTKKPFTFRYSIISMTFLIVNTIFLISIILSILTQKHETRRVMAAMNTCLITYSSLFLSNYYSNKKLNIKRLSRYMFRNMVIMFLIFLLYIALGEHGNFGFMPRPLCGPDWINGVYRIRFRGYLEYTNLIIYMYLYCFPISLLYVKNRFCKAECFIYEILWIFPILSTNSRTGIACGFVMVLSSISVFNSKTLFQILKKHKVLILILGVLFIGILIITFYQKASIMLTRILFLREGSTNTRFELYRASIEKMIKTSPVFGCGIKDLYGGFPYGSHSTYIGMFYKTGFLGGTIFLAGITTFLIKLFKDKETNAYIFMIKIGVFCVFALSALEDLDGSDWSITLFLSLISICFINRNSYQILRKIRQ